MTISGTFDLVDLTPERAFRISRGTTEVQSVAMVRLEDEAGNVGYGCGAPSEYYGESSETLERSMPELIEVAESIDDPFATWTLSQRLAAETQGSEPAARAALDIAFYDLVSTRVGAPLYRYLGFGGEHTLRSSYTIGIDAPEEMAAHASEAIERGYDVLKVKLGTDTDIERTTAIRAAAPDATIRVDANAAWDVDGALTRIGQLDDLGIEFVEQPLPAEDIDGLKTLYEESPLPIAVDEGCVTAEDVPTVADRSDIVVVKLMKTGGIRGALDQIVTARSHGCAVMLGCMLESAASISGAAHLTPLASYADLDGALLVGDDPYTTSAMEEVEIRLNPSMPAGSGVRKDTSI